MLQRHSLRLHDYDYTQDGVYFVTVCCQNRECIFGDVTGGEMQLNRWGEIVLNCWRAIPQHFAGVELDDFMMMPNHIHGIIVINRWTQEYLAKPKHALENVGARHALPLRNPEPHVPIPASGRPIAGSLGIIVGSFKSAATKRINEQRGTPGATIWQRNYYEHIIRNEDSLNKTRQYIQTNPAQWDADLENPANGHA
jgi:REP element-mobilizing transposase RayT